MRYQIGLITEDESDAKSIRILIHRIANDDKIKVKHFLGQGCGKIRRKCNSWAEQLHMRGCNLLIVLHDLDASKLTTLTREIETALNPCPIKKYLICIPVQEFEAWLLSDPMALKKCFNLKKLPKSVLHPERINSPKEHLSRVISDTSLKEKIYINTKHNEVIAKHISINMAKSKCPSFNPFYKFISSNLVLSTKSRK